LELTRSTRGCVVTLNRLVDGKKVTRLSAHGGWEGVVGGGKREGVRR